MKLYVLPMYGAGHAVAVLQIADAWDHRHAQQPLCPNSVVIQRPSSVWFGYLMRTLQDYCVGRQTLVRLGQRRDVTAYQEAAHAQRAGCQIDVTRPASQCAVEDLTSADAQQGSCKGGCWAAEACYRAGAVAGGL